MSHISRRVLLLALSHSASYAPPFLILLNSPNSGRESGSFVALRFKMVANLKSCQAPTVGR